MALGIPGSSPSDSAGAILLRFPMFLIRWKSTLNPLDRWLKMTSLVFTLGIPGSDLSDSAEAIFALFSYVSETLSVKKNTNMNSLDRELGWK